jgi:hypothetical protein
VPLSLSQYNDLLNNMTIEKINKIKIVASSKFSTNEESLNFSNTLIVCPILLTKKPNLPKAYPSAARPSSTSETRRIPSPSHRGFGFVGNIYISIYSFYDYLSIK